MTDYSDAAAGRPDDESDLLRINGLVVEYKRRSGGGRSKKFTAVDGVDFTIRRGETVGLVGESGSGKSTIGSAILGLVPAAGGTVALNGVDITHSSREERRLQAQRMQVVFQDPYGSMNPGLTVGDTLSEALRYNLRMPRPEITRRVLQALDDVGLAASAMEKYPSEFSGGQRQRLAIARALVMDPEFIVCDEAVSALDLSVQAQVLNLLADLREQRGLSYLFISHDLSVVRYLSDYIVVLYQGRVVEQGPALQVTDSPRHPYTRSLLAAAPVPDPDAQEARRGERRRLRSLAEAAVGPRAV